MSAEPRHSHRLRGLEPEERGLQCFICQRDIEIDTLPRCQRTSCCGVFLHRLCHREMVTCGNCRRKNAEFESESVFEFGEVVLETDKEMEEEDNLFDIGTIPVSNASVIRELTEYRDEEARHLNAHYEGSVHWNACRSTFTLACGTIFTACWSDLPICFSTRICTCRDVWWYPVR